MKRTFAMLLLFALLLTSLVGCADEPITNETTAPPKETDAPAKRDDPKIDTTDYAAAVKGSFLNLAPTAEALFTYIDVDGGLAITGYLGESTVVRIPEKIGDKTVVAIADGAFEIIKPDKKEEGETENAENTENTENTEEEKPTAVPLTVLFIPDSVTAIGKRILSGNETLTALRTPLLSAKTGDAQYIGYLFGGDSYRDNGKAPLSLAHVWYDTDATALSDHAFADCNKLVAVLLGESVREIGDFAFSFCGTLKYVNTEHVTKIGRYAFSSCGSFVKAELTAAVTSVGYGAYQGCAALSSMTLPFVGGTMNDNMYLGYIFGAEFPEFTAGFIPAYLREITVLEGSTALGNYAFFECSSLYKINLPSTLKTVGVRAFEGCDMIETLTLPDGLEDIRENAFVGCKSLRSVVLGKSLKTLGINAFYGCTALEGITLPNTLNALPASAFADCCALAEIDLGGVLTVGKNAFRNCHTLKTVKTVNTVTLESGNGTVEAILYPTEE